MFVAIGCGSNLGNLKANFYAALSMLKSHNVLQAITSSRVYRSQPLQLKGDLAPQSEYLNMALTAATDLTPENLLKALKYIERALGRVDNEKKWQARVIDLDILLYEQHCISQHNLIIPHPEMLNRDFVLKPLCNLIAGYYHPQAKSVLYSSLENLRANKYICGQVPF